jgi:hypothetical protein
MSEGPGAPAPTAQGLQTNMYTVLHHAQTQTVLQLYHGSTGAIMFRSGPAPPPPADAVSDEPPSADRMLVGAAPYLPCLPRVLICGMRVFVHGVSRMPRAYPRAYPVQMTPRKHKR